MSPDRPEKTSSAGGDAARNTKPDGGVQQMFAELRERAGREPGLFNDIGDDRRHGAKDVALAREWRKAS